MEREIPNPTSLRSREMEITCQGKKYLIEPGVNLSGADLSEANLSGADLTGVDLLGANLSGTDITRAFHVPGTEEDDDGHSKNH